ncbi:MAG: chorismate pyruvate-lyase family protein [Actinomycetota bacterium]|nr:chorismate pyruvate-lyase family protein [Actinomycetota bacterium]
MTPSRDLAAAGYFGGFFSGTEPPVAPPATTVGAPLTRFQRVLLTTDGTVTRILEAYADEPMEAVKLLHALDTSDAGDADLIVPGQRVLRRWVLLRGRLTGQTFLYAEAVVAVDLVDPVIVDRLVTTDKAIGVLLAESRTETFREVLRVDREPAGRAAAHFGTQPTAELILRTYRIVVRGRPVVLITEKFPSDFFRSLPA